MITQVMNTTMVRDLPNKLEFSGFSLTLHQSHKLKVRTALINERLSTLCSLNKDEYISVYRIDDTSETDCFGRDDYLGGCEFTNNAGETLTILSYYEYKGSIECKLFIFE